MRHDETAWYRIGDLVLRVESDLPFDMESEDLRPFRIDEAPADYIYRFCKCDNMQEIVKDTRMVCRFFFGADLIGKNGEHFRALNINKLGYEAVIRLDEQTGVIFYESEAVLAKLKERGFSLVHYFVLEHLFYRYGGFILHSTHVNVGGRALLFSAPSGTGKSTQADLWGKYVGTELINGDRTLLRKKDGVWHAYGCPMSGTSDVHKQGCEPIYAIVMLSQDTENTVRRLTPKEAIRRIYQEFTVPNWSRELVLKAMEMLDDLMAQVPIYALACTPDERAVIALREAIGL